MLKNAAGVPICTPNPEPVPLKIDDNRIPVVEERVPKNSVRLDEARRCEIGDRIRDAERPDRERPLGGSADETYLISPRRNRDAHIASRLGGNGVERIYRSIFNGLSCTYFSQ